jgi:hypothetical protein
MFAIGWNLRKSITLFAVLASLVSFSKAYAEDISVFDARNTIALSDAEPTYKDYYLNGGTARGLREGMIITVVRKVTLYDSYQNKSAGEMELEVGKIKIIHVQKDLAVARDHAQISRVGHPLLDYDFVMLGDVLDLDTMTTEGKNKSASNDEGSSAPTGSSVEAVPGTPAIPAAPEQKSAEPQARKESTGFAIDFASQAATISPDAPAAPVSKLQ